MARQWRLPCSTHGRVVARGAGPRSIIPYISCFGPLLSVSALCVVHIPLLSLFVDRVISYHNPYYRLGGPLTDLLPYDVYRYCPVVDKAVLLFHLLAIALA